MSGSARTHQKNRAKLRKKLRAEGVAEEAIDRFIERRAFEHLQRRHGLAGAQTIRYNEVPDSPDDTRYKPTPGDKLTRGAGRVTESTARVIKSGKTITQHQYRERES